MFCHWLNFHVDCRWITVCILWCSLTLSWEAYTADWGWVSFHTIFSLNEKLCEMQCFNVCSQSVSCHMEARRRPAACDAGDRRRKNKQSRSRCSIAGISSKRHLQSHSVSSDAGNMIRLSVVCMSVCWLKQSSPTPLTPTRTWRYVMCPCGIIDCVEKHENCQSNRPHDAPKINKEVPGTPHTKHV